MSKSFRRRRFFASFREVALILLLSATFVGFVGCAGGSNPFCCDSKEKNKIDQNLERAQSLDENEKNARSSEESKKSEEIKENDEDDEETIHAIILKTDGSGNAPQIADAAAQTVAQEVPVTVSPSDANELLQAPVLPSTTSTGLTATAAPSDVATADSNETSAQTDATADVPETTAQTNDSPVGDEATTALENAPQEASNAPVSPTQTQAQEEPQPENATEEAKEEPQPENATEEAKAEPRPEENAPPQNDATARTVRSARRGVPQRAGSRQIVQRDASRPVAVPQTRAAATLDAAPVLTFRTSAVVPAVDASRAATVDAEPTPVVSFRTRVVVP